MMMMKRSLKRKQFVGSAMMLVMKEILSEWSVAARVLSA